MYNQWEVFSWVGRVKVSSDVEGTAYNLTNLRPEDGKVKLEFSEECRDYHLQHYAAHLSSVARQKSLKHLW